jgi:hypothetical protein
VHETSHGRSQRFVNNGLSVISNSAFNFNCTHTCIINSQSPPYTRCLNFTDENNNCRIIGDKLFSYNFRYFRYAKNWISIFLKYRYFWNIDIYRKYRYLSKISIYRNCLQVGGLGSFSPLLPIHASGKCVTLQLARASFLWLKLWAFTSITWTRLYSQSNVLSGRVY